MFSSFANSFWFGFKCTVQSYQLPQRIPANAVQTDTNIHTNIRKKETMLKGFNKGIKKRV